MKKVIRLSENDLNRLVKKIINEAPFDMDSIERLDTNPDKLDFDKKDKEVIDKFKIAKSKYDEFEKSDVRKLLFDMEMLLVIAKDYCNNHKYDEVGQPHQYCSGIKYIEDNMNKFHSGKHSKRNPYQSQPIYPKRPKID
jgi:hypothetical protein